MSFLESLACSIATAEGAFVPGSVPNRLNNPGDLLFAGQPNAEPHQVVGPDGKVRIFAEFPKWEQGVVALYRQILARAVQGITLKGLINLWAPASDGNNTTNYLNETMRRLAASGTPVDPNAPLWKYLELKQVP